MKTDDHMNRLATIGLAMNMAVNRLANLTPRIASGRNVTRDEGLGFGRRTDTGVAGLWAGRSDHHTQRRPQARPGRMPGGVIGCADMDAMIVSAIFCRKDRSRR